MANALKAKWRHHPASSESEDVGDDGDIDEQVSRYNDDKKAVTGVIINYMNLFLARITGLDHHLFIYRPPWLVLN
jgi:hypothetical protein